jgi:hypothetical protein
MNMHEKKKLSRSLCLHAMCLFLWFPYSATGGGTVHDICARLPE